MPGAIRFGAAILAAFGVACASSVDVSIDQRRDLAGYRTWSFLALRSRSVFASERDARALEARLSQLVERCLAERGFERVAGRPDFYVSYSLAIRRQQVIVTETPAMEHVYSMDHTPSYEVQASKSRVEIHELGEFTVLLTDPSDRAVVWRGGFAGRLRGERDSQLQDAVASVLGHIPDAGDARGAPPASGKPGRACASSGTGWLR